ncbi:RES domain-containing protein [Bacillus mycoides]|uniref:RES domain-containing protein n=1 Tax=Bacillus mycoides TaxID=1405 RepID=UPI000BF0BA09|nr:RES domain-containing protein [Bacillus mycoides]PEK86903.1 hypothetical protein CN600_28760 [Bacillus mycoides]
MPTDFQFKLAVTLTEIEEITSITDKQAKQAHELYLSLSKRPNFILLPNEVKSHKSSDKSIEPISENFFKNPLRIKVLTEWVLKILPFVDLFSEVASLPISRNEDDFEGFVRKILDNYLTSIKLIYTTIPPHLNVLQSEDLINIDKLIEKIYFSIEEYHNGYPDKAYKELKIGIDTFLKKPGYLENVFSIEEDQRKFLYKMRVGSNHTYSSEEMFHIPYEKRGLVKTNRYSIPGLPCVYLGSSPLTCWEELNKPDLNTVQTSLFISNNLAFLDISTPPAAIIDRLNLLFTLNCHADMEKTYKELKSYIVMLPLIATCSIRVKNANDQFKPEYIVPQLLLQWIRQSNYDGICYFSTKIKKYGLGNIPFYRNYAFPVQERKAEGHCQTLRSKFGIITDAVPWQMFQLYKGSPLATPNTERTHTELEFVDGMSLKYMNTDFSCLETFLVNTLQH